MRVVPSTGRTPPSGTTIVWPATVGVRAVPSTVTTPSRIDPSLAAIVLNSIRSIGPPDVLRTVAVESTRIVRAPQVMPRSAWYVASRNRLERPTDPGTMSAAPAAVAGPGGEGRGVGSRSETDW